MDRAFLVLAGLSVVDGAVWTYWLDLPMLAVGGLALGGHFILRVNVVPIQRLRLVALLAGIAIAGSTIAHALGGGSLPSSQSSLLVAWLYWLAVFVAVAERSATRRFRNAMVIVIGFTASAVATFRILEALIAGKYGTADLFLMSRNGYGATLAVLAPLAIAAWYLRSRRAGALWASVFIAALVVNGSRGSWIAALAWVAVFAIAAVSMRPKLKREQWLVLLVAGTVMLIAADRMVGSWDAFEPIRFRAATVQTLNEDASAETRLALQQKALMIFEEEPVVGVGLGNFRRTSIGNEAAIGLPFRHQAVFADLTAHNSYLELLAEGGILGSLLVFVLIIAAVGTALVVAVRFCRVRSATTLAIAASVVSLTVYLGLKGGLGTTIAWVVLGLWVGTANELLSRRPHPLRGGCGPVARRGGLS